jgi:uncharacterized membrane protein YbhN (UPF0104 family)
MKERLRGIWRRSVRWIPALGLAAAMGLLGWFAWRDRAALLEALATARFGWLAASFGVFSVDLLLVIAIWARLLQALGVNLPFRDHFLIYAQANAGKRLPGTLWYVASRVSLYEQRGIAPVTIAVASGLEFLLSFTTSAIFGLVTVGDLLWTQVLPHLAADVGMPALIAIVTGLAATGAGVAAAGSRLLRKRLGPQVDWRALRLPTATWLRLGAAYVCVWLLGGIFLLCICLAFAPWPALEQLRLTIGTWALSSMLATVALLLPSSLGVKELSVGFLLGTALPASTAVLAAVLARLMTTTFDFAWSAVVFVFATRLRRRRK